MITCIVTPGPRTFLFELWETNSLGIEEMVVASMSLPADTTMLQCHNKVRTWWSQYFYSKVLETSPLPSLDVTFRT